MKDAVRFCPRGNTQNPYYVRETQTLFLGETTQDKHLTSLEMTLLSYNLYVSCLRYKKAIMYKISVGIEYFYVTGGTHLSVGLERRRTPRRIRTHLTWNVYLFY